jgi:hypothetical protein
MRSTTLASLALLLLAACTDGPRRQPPTAGPIRAEDGGAAGYQHGLDRSRVSLGADRRIVDERGFLKVVGPTATFAVDATNGAAAAIPNASRIIAAEEGAPRPVDPERHNQQVVDYFVGAGIPREQVAGVDALTLLAARGETRSPQPPQPEVIGYQSALKRSIGGVTVADSVAWARLTDRSEVLSEGVYWPALPRAAVTEAAEFQRRLNDAQQRQLFLASLPTGLPEGEVVIHHSQATTRGEFQVVVTYDVAAPVNAPVPAGAGANDRPVSWVVRHFDIQGREIRLPQEQPPPGSERGDARQ